MSRFSSKDRDIVTRSFKLLSNGIRDPDKLMKAVDYDLETSFFSTAVGDNRYVNPLPGFGFNTDPGPITQLENRNGNLGPYYKRIYDDNATLLTLTAGVAEFPGLLRFITNMFDYGAATIANKGRAPSISYYITAAMSSIAFWPMQLISTGVTFLSYLMNENKNQWYYVKNAMGHYYAAVQGVFNDLMVNAGYAITVLNDSRQEQGNIKYGDRDYKKGGLNGYGIDSNDNKTTAYQVKKDNIAYMNSLFPDAINKDGTIDIVKLVNRGVRKYRLFLQNVKNLDNLSTKMSSNPNNFTMTNKDRDIAVEGILKNLVNDPEFMNDGYNNFGLDHYLKQDLGTVAGVRGENEILHPEVASSYYDVNAAKNIVPVDSDGNILEEYGINSGAYSDDNTLSSILDRAASPLDHVNNTNETPPSDAVSIMSGTKANQPSRSLGSELPDNGFKDMNKNISEESYLGQISEILKDQFLGGMDAITFRVEGGGGPVSDSFSAQTSESPLAGMFNSASQSVQDFKFSVQGGQTGISVVDEFVNQIKDGIAGLADGSVLGRIPLTLMGNGRVNFPEYWTDSTTNFHTERYTIYSEAAYAHPYCIATSVYLPIALIAPFLFPINVGGSTYTTPFLCKAFSRGKTIVKTGIMRSATITLGNGPMGWTRDFKPLNVKIELEIDDLDKNGSIPISRVRNPLDAINISKQAAIYLGDIGKYNDWVNRIAGIDYLDSVLKFNDINRRITRFKTDLKYMVSPSNIATTVTDSVFGTAAQAIFAPRPLNR